MSIKLKQSTASQEVPLGPFVDKTDGSTAEAALTIANTDIKLWKTGATALVSKNSGGATYMSNGVYYTVLDATDTATLGPLVIFVHITAEALPVRVECEVLLANVYDALVGGTEFLEVTSLKPDWSISGTTLTVLERDESTTQFTKVLTGTPGADPITAAT
jgi:hypothetical protein